MVGASDFWRLFFCPLGQGCRLLFSPELVLYMPFLRSRTRASRCKEEEAKKKRGKSKVAAGQTDGGQGALSQDNLGEYY